MLIMLCTGKLIRDPQGRTGAAGKPYATGLLAVPRDSDQMLVSCIAFGDCAKKLLAHSKGDTLALLGKGNLSSWEKDGKARHGLSMTVDKFLSPYELRSQRKSVARPVQTEIPWGLDTVNERPRGRHES